MQQEKLQCNCCGCGACALKCPKQAITMQEDNMGFLIPVIDNQLCIDCGLCEKVCSFKKQQKHKWQPLKVYGGRLKDLEALSKSQSGGAFWAFACQIIKNNGVVYGVALTDSFTATHIRVTSIHDLQRLRGSKYIQSVVGDAYCSVAADLKQGRKVLFSGTPCQVSGLMAYLSPKQYENLYTVDLVCHGVPSPQVWKDYLNWIENKVGDKITHCNFRDKKYGWGSHIETFIFEKKREITQSIFKELFYRNLIIRESCHNCPFTNLSRVSDVTVGDYWGWSAASNRFCDQKGISLILINTIKGDKLFEAAKQDLLIEASNVQDCLQPQLKHPAERPLNKDEFIKDYHAKGFEYALRKYAIIGWRHSIKNLLEQLYLFVQKVNFHLKRMKIR